MPANRKWMRQIREVLRQKWALGLSKRQIAAGCGISRPTVGEYLKRTAITLSGRPTGWCAGPTTPAGARRMRDIEALDFEERLGLLVDREITERAARRLQTRP